MSLTALDTWLPGFTSVVAVTSSAVATISETGRYAEPLRVGEPWVCAPHRVTLRIDEHAVGGVRASPSGRAAVVVEGRDGVALHRSLVVSRDDLSRYEALRWAGAPEVGPCAPCPEVGTPDVGVRCAGLADAHTRDHVDVVLRGCPVRTAVLRRLGPSHCDEVGAAGVVALLERVADLRVPVTVAVPTPGLLQAAAGPLTLARGLDTRLCVAVGRSRTSVDLAEAGSCWVVRPVRGPAVVEVHDRRGACALLLTLSGTPDHADAARWEHLTEQAALGRA